MVTIDGSNYVLPIPVDEIISKSAPDLCLFDDGTCYYVQDVIYSYNNDFTKDTYCFYITPSEVKAINTEIEYFDFDTHEIKLLNNRRDNNDSHNPRNFWNLPQEIYSEEKGDWFINYDFYLQDKSKRHSFLPNGITTIFLSTEKNIIMLALSRLFMTTKATHLDGYLLRRTK